jgi:hypothetical protein
MYKQYENRSYILSEFSDQTWSFIRHGKQINDKNINLNKLLPKLHKLVQYFWGIMDGCTGEGSFQLLVRSEFGYGGHLEFGFLQSSLAGISLTVIGMPFVFLGENAYVGDHVFCRFRAGSILAYGGHLEFGFRMKS